MAIFQYTFRGADMDDLPPKPRDLIENRDQELELYLNNLPAPTAAPTGAMTAFAGSAAPSGWLLCDGSSVSTATYATLFAVIGYTYGGSGSSFNLPNLKGRVPVGRDTAQTEFDSLAETGGAKTVTLSTSEMPNHDHYGQTLATTHTHTASTNTTGSHQHLTRDFPNDTKVIAAGTDVFYRVGQDAYTQAAGDHSHTVTVNNESAHVHAIYSEGGGGAHNNLQPYLVVNWIIKS
jgi:microcystin-dependent protein